MVAARQVYSGVGGPRVDVNSLHLGEDLPHLVVGPGRIDDGIPEGDKSTEGRYGLAEAIASFGDECAAGAKDAHYVVHEIDLLWVGVVWEEATPSLSWLGHRPRFVSWSI